ncbi:hypothetical protein UFOVP787_138 [uncultured Caudovirales phage]|uniref:DUF7936 domain-containing protein n=1 Tax=uncultured Caudovirales phage TaxID=2100421 RepID=A0A6J5P5N7_9CAUD|nr:hypothetical protein UFOVP787_138 [uncultured Caudovirales phage]
MSIIYTWGVDQMICYPTYESQTDVVNNVAWRVDATDGTYNATSYSTVDVIYVAGSSYTPYNSLTQDQVVGWVRAVIGPEQIAKIEADLATQIANLANPPVTNQANPPVVIPPLPWSVTSEQDVDGELSEQDVDGESFQ